MTEDDWNELINDATAFILEKARSSIGGEPSPADIRGKISEFQQEAMRNTFDLRADVKAALLAIAKAPN